MMYVLQITDKVTGHFHENNVTNLHLHGLQIKSRIAIGKLIFRSRLSAATTLMDLCIC